jgi:hypothetical protein
MMTVWALVWFLAGAISALTLMMVAAFCIAGVLAIGVGGAALRRSRKAHWHKGGVA